MRCSGIAHTQPCVCTCFVMLLGNSEVVRVSVLGDVAFSKLVPGSGDCAASLLRRQPAHWPYLLFADTCHCGVYVHGVMPQVALQSAALQSRCLLFTRRDQRADQGRSCYAQHPHSRVLQTVWPFRQCAEGTACTCQTESALRCLANRMATVPRPNIQGLLQCTSGMWSLALWSSRTLHLSASAQNVGVLLRLGRAAWHPCSTSSACALSQGGRGGGGGGGGGGV